MGATYVENAAPGLAKAFRSAASGPATKEAATLFGAKNIAEISKLAQEAEKVALENQRNRGVNPNQDLYGATQAGVNVPEFQQYQQFRQGGGPMPMQPTGMTPNDDEGNPNVAPMWNADQQSKLANALRTVALMRSSTAPYSPDNVVKAQEGQQGMDAMTERLAAARQPDTADEAPPQGSELERRLAAAAGHNVLAEPKDDRIQFEKGLDAAGIKDPEERSKLLKQFLQKLATHPSAVNINNYPGGLQRGTDASGQPGTWQIGHDGKSRFIPTGDVPQNDPLKAFIANALKNPGAPTNQNAALKAKVEAVPGWKWEPAIYDYREVGGKLQRQKKGS